MKKILLLLAVLLIIVCCKTNYPFIEKHPVKEVPLIDSTSFSNHKSGELLTRKQMRNLDLYTVLGRKDLKDEKAKIGISYLPKLSNNFTSIVYYFYSDDNILQSILVNYDTNFKLIDYQMVAFDEIADGFLRATSTINKDQIILKEYNSNISNEPTELVFSISSEGKITRK